MTIFFVNVLNFNTLIFVFSFDSRVASYYTAGRIGLLDRQIRVSRTFGMPFAQAVTRHSVQGGLDQIFCQTLLSCLNDADEKPQFRQIVQPYCPCLSSALFKRGTRYVFLLGFIVESKTPKSHSEIN